MSSNKVRKKVVVAEGDGDDYLKSLVAFESYVSSSNYQGGVTCNNNTRDSGDSGEDTSGENSDYFSSNDDDSDYNSSDDEEDHDDYKPGPSRKRKSGRSGNNGPACCPFPAPKAKGRERKQEVETVFQESQDVTKLSQLLRNRTSLNPVIQNDDAAVPVQHGPLENIQILKSSMDMLQKSIPIRNWANEIKRQATTCPEKFMLEHLIQFYSDKLPLRLEKEFLFWAYVPDESKGPSSTYHFWKTELKQYTRTHPEWRSYSDEHLNEMIQEAGIKVLMNTKNLNIMATKILAQILEWIKNIEAGLQKTLLFMKKFRVLEAEIESKNKNLDEFCHWGKKNLQEMFTAPYFKLSSQDYCNLVDQKEFLENTYGDALIDVKKQKWTTKDFRALKKFIKDVIIDAEYAKYVERYNYLMSRIIFERTNRLQEDEEKHRANQKRRPNPDSIIYDELGHGIGSGKGNPRINRKKRVADCEHAKTTTERCFKIPIAGVKDNSSATVIEVRAQITIKAHDLQKWFHQNEAKLKKLTYELLMKEERYIALIDWFKVAKKMTVETGKDRTANDCYLAWKHEAHTAVNSKRWPAAEMNKLMDCVNSHLDNEDVPNVDWEDIATQIGNNRTTYQCFYQYRNKVVQSEIMSWDDDKTNKVVEVIRNEGAKWGKAVEATGDQRATKHQVQERWKKTCNPMLRHGAFTRVEDALLLLAMQKLKGFISKEQHFGVLISYLPWRFETVWRDRANNLFSSWIVPWTVEEDKMLIDFAESQSGGRKDWQQIVKKFSSFKNRKGCLTRYKILCKRIGPKSDQFKSVEEYHEKYSMTRYNVRQYQHLHDVMELLNRVLQVKRPTAPFIGLSNNAPPDETELRHMLLDYDRDVVAKTIKSIEKYIESRNAYWKPWTEQNGHLRKTFDRRSFHRSDPQSVASAVHVRAVQGLHLVPKQDVEGEPLTPFESDVYNYYARFSRTKSLKNMERRYIPTAKKLSKLPEISRIVVFDWDKEESSGSDWNDGSETPPVSRRKRGRPPKTSKSTKQKKKKGEQPKRQKRKTRSVVSYEELDGNVTAVEVDDDMKPPLPRKRGRPAKSCRSVVSNDEMKPRLSKQGKRPAKVLPTSISGAQMKPVSRKRGRPPKGRPALCEDDEVKPKRRCSVRLAESTKLH